MGPRVPIKSFIKNMPKKPLVLVSELIVELQKVKYSDIQDRKKIMELMSYCIENLPDIFTSQEISLAIEKMLNLKPLPFLFMRTMIQLINRSDQESNKLT